MRKRGLNLRSDPALMRAYKTEWIRKRRQAFFDGKSCASCGETTELELDHIDPKTKTHHAIWSWSKKRRDEELLKCQVLCRKCHIEKSAMELRKLNDLELSVALSDIKNGMSLNEAAKKNKIARKSLSIWAQRSKVLSPYQKKFGRGKGRDR